MHPWRQLYEAEYGPLEPKPPAEPQDRFITFDEAEVGPPSPCGSPAARGGWGGGADGGFDDVLAEPEPPVMRVRRPEDGQARTPPRLVRRLLKHRRDMIGSPDEQVRQQQEQAWRAQSAGHERNQPEWQRRLAAPRPRPRSRSRPASASAASTAGASLNTRVYRAFMDQVSRRAEPALLGTAAFFLASGRGSSAFAVAEGTAPPSSAAAASSAALQTQPGALSLIFSFYARLLPPGAGQATYDRIRHANETMAFGELFLFARDFQLIPHLLSKQELRLAWKCRAAEPDEAYSPDMSFSEFVDCLVRVALLVFSRPGAHSVSPLASAEEKTLALIRYLRLAEIGHVRRKLLVTGRLTEGVLHAHVSSDTRHRLLADRASARERDAAAPSASREPMTLKEAARKLRHFSKDLLSLFEPHVTHSPSEPWERFEGPFVDVGCVAPGALRRFRISVTNTGTSLIYVAVELEDLPGFSVKVSEAGLFLPPGLVRTVELTLRAGEAAAEHIGAVVLVARDPHGRVVDEDAVPVYMRVTGHSAPKGGQQPLHGPGSSRGGWAPRRSVSRTGALHSYDIAQHRRRPSSASAASASGGEDAAARAVALHLAGAGGVSSPQSESPRSESSGGGVSDSGSDYDG